MVYLFWRTELNYLAIIQCWEHKYSSYAHKNKSLGYKLKFSKVSHNWFSFPESYFQFS